MYINTSSILYAYNKYSTQLANCHELRTHISMNVIDIHFSDNHQVIVADNLSKRLLESYLSDQRYQSGHLAHQTPDILDWWQWIDHTIEKSAPNCSWLQSYTVLSAQQELSLWHQIICLDAAENIPDSELIDLYALAKRASRSRLKQQQWNILGKSQNLNEDHQAFTRWNTEFEEICHKRKFIDLGSRENVVEKLLLSQVYPIAPISFFGFQALTPLQEKIINKISEHQPTSCFSHVSTSHLQPIASLYANEEEEINEIIEAIYVRYRPDQKNVFVVSAVNDRQKLERIRKSINTLNDKSKYPQLKIQHSGNVALLEEAIAINAIVLLRAVVHGKLLLKEFLDILYSRWLDTNHEALQEKIELEHALRERGSLYVSPKDRSHIFPLNSTSSENIESRYFTQLFGNRKLFSGNHSLIYWGEVFNTHLSNIGWPGSTTNMLRLQPFIQKVRESVSRLTDGSIDNENVSAQKALVILLNATFMQSVPTIVSGVDVLLVEDSNLNLPAIDTVWICNANDNWIPTTTLDPFIATHAQRSATIPGTIPESMHLTTTHSLHQMKAQGTAIYFSCVPDIDSGQHHPSAIVEEFTNWKHKEAATDISPTSYKLPVEAFHDSIGLPFTATIVPGGVNVLSDHSDCEFRAYARYRLNARDQQSPLPGEDPRSRGNIVHTVLEKLWNAIKNSDNLKKLTETQLDDSVRRLTQSTIAQIRKHHATGFGDKFDSLETNNIVELITEFLKIERNRPDFSVVETEFESQLMCHSSNLQFNLRIDRIDRLSDDTLLLIDYKTGKTSLPKWTDERLPMPQLPAYAISKAHSVAGICFMVLHPTETKILGISNHDLTIMGIKSITKINAYNALGNWKQLNDHWLKSLDSLAITIKNGHAHINPRDTNTCRYCDIKPFCRITQQTNIDTLDSE